MTTLIIATRNAHKVEEIRAVLGSRFDDYPTLRDLPGAPDPEETGETFEANARIKAHALARWLMECPPAGWRRMPVIPRRAVSVDLDLHHASASEHRHQ